MSEAEVATARAPTLPTPPPIQTLKYVQRTGRFLDQHGHLIGVCYSGDGPGLNNPAMQAVARVGPIPAGRWKIGPAYHHPHLGPVVMDLDAVVLEAALGRSLFRIHGDNSSMNHTASLGCIVMWHGPRVIVAASPVQVLDVVAEESNLAGLA